MALLGERGETFSGHRLRHFQAVLPEALVFDCRDPEAAAQVRSFAPEVVVTAGTYGPTRVALSVIGDQPLWIDLPGDPFADAQAAGGGDPNVVTEAASVFVPALLRGDAFSTISRPSRFALLGQLGLLGRLAAVPPGSSIAPGPSLVHHLPVACTFPLVPARHGPRPRPLRILLSGSFNAWFDGETALSALLLAMDRAPVEVVVTGGLVEGHAEAGYAQFRSGALASRHADRFAFHGWLPPEAMGRVWEGCQVGLCLDQPGQEPELGSRTRVLHWLSVGLSVVATPRCELVAALCEWGLATPVGGGDGDGWTPPTAGEVADALLGDLQVPTAKAQADLRLKYDLLTTGTGLRNWVFCPVRLPAGPGADPALLLFRDRERLQGELRALRASPTFRLFDRGRRLSRTLLSGNLSGDREDR